MKYPQTEDCKPGLWVELSNGWIVGPIVKTEFTGIYVKFHTGTWQLDVMGQDRVTIQSSRLVNRVGTREQLIKNCTRET